MSKASRNSRRIQRALAVEERTIIDRDWGLNVDPAADIDASEHRQVIDIVVQTSAVHSRSLGWIPALLLEYTHVPLLAAGTDQETHVTKLQLIGTEAILSHIATLNSGVDRALADIAAGMKLYPPGV